jgi:hypothetical protein
MLDTLSGFCKQGVTTACYLEILGSRDYQSALRLGWTLLLPKTSSMLVGADAWVRPMLCAMAAGGALVRQGNAVAW